MATDTYSVQANQTTATQVVFAGDGPTLVINTSLTDNVFLSEDNSARVSDANGLIPIGPNGSMVVDGKRDFYAVTASVTPITIATVAGGLGNFRALTSGLGKLAIPSIQSPNFQASPLIGWSIDQNGNAFFETVTIGGGVVRVTFAAAPPSNPNEGDVWFNLSAGAQPNVFQSGAFTPFQWGQPSIANAAIGTPQIANNAVTPAQIANLTARLIGQTGGVLNNNPYFTGNDGVGWAAGGTAVLTITNAPPVGSPFPNAAQLVGAGTNSNKLFNFNSCFSVQPNTQYLVSGFVYSPVATVNFGIDWRDSARTFLSQSTPAITVPINTWTPISVVVTSPSTAGLALGNINLSPIAPGGTMYATGLIAFPQIPGALIQASSITAAQIAAGVILAGVIDGTIVNAATFNGSTFNGTDFIFNNTGLYIYSGAPAFGNLIASITPTNGLDPKGNTTDTILSVYGIGGAVMNFKVTTGTPQQNFITAAATENEPATTFAQINNKGLANESMSLLFVGPSSSLDDHRAVIIHTSAAHDASSGANAQLVIMQGAVIIATVATWDIDGLHTSLPVFFGQVGGTPLGISGQATVFSINGDLAVVDGADMASYQTQRRSLVPTGPQNVTSTSFGTILQSPIGAPASTHRVYRIEGRVVINPNQTGGKASLRWTGPAGVTGFISFVYFAGTASDNSSALGNGTSDGGAITMTMISGTQILVIVTGSIDVPAGTTGTFTIDAACGTAGDTFTVGQYSSIDVMPV